MRRRVLLILLTLALLTSCLLLLIQSSNYSSSHYALRWGDQQAVLSTRASSADEKQHGLRSAALRVVHLDLKGAPPKISYLKKILPLLAAEGCSALLIEYEDMFPYQGALANISAKNAYSKEQILDLLSWAHHLGLEVIPLVQTFGHLEFVLKLEEFRHLRELDSFPQEVCPRASGTQALLQEIIQQVMSVHQKSRYLHIGCDEVYHLAACPRCSQTGKSGRVLFMEHVTKVAEFVRSMYPGVTPIIWDDMLRRWDPTFLSKSSLGHLVEPMVWVYTEDISRLVPHYVWHWYSKVFPRIWVAGAFKGATHPTSLLPDIRMHYNNQKSWLRFLSRASSDAPIAGYVLTGWSRYDHFAVLCELLPSAIPSLLLNLILVFTQESETKVLKMWKSALKCPTKSALTIDTTQSNHRPIAMCRFPGLNLFLSTSKYMSLKSKVDHFHQKLTEQNGWMTPFNIKHNFSSPYRILEDFRLDEGYRLIKEIRNFRNESKQVLLEYFDTYTVSEWIEQKIQPMVDKLDYLQNASNRLVARRNWPRRPISMDYG